MNDKEREAVERAQLTVERLQAAMESAAVAFVRFGKAYYDADMRDRLAHAFGDTSPVIR